MGTTAPYRLWTLGTAHLEGWHAYRLRPVLLQPKRLALLAFLAAATPTGPHRRDTVLALLWPELDVHHARAALRQALFQLDQGLVHGVVRRVGNEELSISDEFVWCDARAFDRAVRESRWADALALYAGGFLRGFHLADAPDFERWLDDEAQARSNAAVWAVDNLLDAAEHAGLVQEAIRWAKRRIELEPLSELGYARLIDLLQRTGDRSAGHVVYHRLRSRLHRELELAPSEETRRHLQRQ
jgi:DNA-binding SARP family transcriptional activator